MRIRPARFMGEFADQGVFFPLDPGDTVQDWSTDHAQGLLEAAPDAIIVVTEDG